MNRRNFVTVLMGCAASLLAGCMPRRRKRHVVEDEPPMWEVTYGWEKYIAARIYAGHWINVERCRLTTSMKNCRTGQVHVIAHDDTDMEDYTAHLKRVVALSGYLNGGTMA